MSSFPTSVRILRLLRGSLLFLVVASYWAPSAAISMAEQPIALSMAEQSLVSVSIAALSLAAVAPSILLTASALSLAAFEPSILLTAAAP